MIRRSLALLVALAAGSAGAAEQVPLYSNLKDWLVACDNTRQCTALSNATEEDVQTLPTWSLSVNREAGPEGALHVGLFSYNKASGQPLLDGKPLQVKLHPGKLTEGSVPEVYSIEGSDAQALIAELRNGQRLVLPTEAGEAVTSLSGMSAALLLMDSVQGRLGTTTALLRKGSNPASSVPPAPAAPPAPTWQAPKPLSEAASKRILEAVREATRSDWEKDMVEAGLPEGQAFALSDHETLVILKTECGAYNCAYNLYQAPLDQPQQARRASIPEIPVFEELPPSGSVEFDPASGELSSFTLAMGMGGCGFTQRWRYDGKGFTPVHATMLGTCLGLDSTYWPVLWRTAEKR
ncbi:DUF1176 domain-containing protein [Pseudomonas sp. PDM11]|uniref:DUF1176 domain-containing protein n=1 Tax=Pseudomonas sp. PDM11 TaxID=2769309 RepID=UPI001783A94B|nr:DUF1176 domain-containing protein [Pseudomonas sp. PDM11]MBD9396596.1 DUF1176 domain-containing protein [Pseudomonas sp. PDM11]